MINMVTFESIWEKTTEGFIPKIQAHQGLEYFVVNRSKFEGWMKVELCETLSTLSDNITPEKDRIDIVINGFAIELKTPNTNYRADKIKNKTRPITKNVDEIIFDIEALKKNLNYEKKSVMFIVFPLPLESENSWQQHLAKIKSELRQIESKEFHFKNGVRGKLYFGLV